MHCNTHCTLPLARNFQEPEDDRMPRRRESIIHLPTSDREATAEELEGFATNRRARPCPPAPIDRSSCSLVYRSWVRVRPSPRALLRMCGMGALNPASKLSRASAQHHPTDTPPGPLKRACRKAWLNPSRPATRSDIAESPPRPSTTSHQPVPPHSNSKASFSRPTSPACSPSSSKSNSASAPS